MFRKKKPATEPGQAVLRSRATSPRDPGRASQTAANPLARRLQQDAEPSTVDLAAAPAFPAADQGTSSNTDPKTATLQAASARLERFISHDPQTGKLYVHPGDGQIAVMLAGNPVLAPTELRPGDEVTIGIAVFRFLPPG